MMSLPPPAPKWVRTDGPSLEPQLKGAKVSSLPPELPTRYTFANLLDSHLATLVTLLKTHTLLRPPAIRAKPWWSPLLSTLRKEFHTSSQKAWTSNDPQDKGVAKLFKQGYFKSIKAAKAQHWKTFLADATPGRQELFGLQKGSPSAESPLGSPTCLTPPPRMRLTKPYYSTSSLPNLSRLCPPF